MLYTKRYEKADCSTHIHIYTYIHAIFIQTDKMKVKVGFVIRVSKYCVLQTNTYSPTHTHALTFTLHTQKTFIYTGLIETDKMKQSRFRDSNFGLLRPSDDPSYPNNTYVYQRVCTSVCGRARMCKFFKYTFFSICINILSILGSFSFSPTRMHYLCIMFNILG